MSEELGILDRGLPPKKQKEQYSRSLGQLKYQVAEELGLEIPRDDYWGNISSRDCGRVGGRIGGYIGGQMVKRMIEIARNTMENGETTVG